MIVEIAKNTDTTPRNTLKKIFNIDFLTDCNVLNKKYDL